MSNEKGILYRTPDGFLAIATKRDGKKLSSQIEENIEAAKNAKKEKEMKVVSSPGNPAPSSSLSNMKKDELLEYAKEIGLELQPSATKQQILEAIDMHQEPSEEDEL